MRYRFLALLTVLLCLLPGCGKAEETMPAPSVTPRLLTLEEARLTLEEKSGAGESTYIKLADNVVSGGVEYFHAELYWQVYDEAEGTEVWAKASDLFLSADGTQYRTGYMNGSEPVFWESAQE